INVQEMDNIIFKGANAAVAHINLDRAPSDTLLEEIKSGDRHILAAHLVTL
ncbi:MAG: hydroxyacid dehydrogenase, partial [Acidobacteria bacterium]